MVISPNPKMKSYFYLVKPLGKKGFIETHTMVLKKKKFNVLNAQSYNFCSNFQINAFYCIKFVSYQSFCKRTNANTLI